ncbi:MAG TPA: cupin domain-containing protein [Armatimonadota bacterium]
MSQRTDTRENAKQRMEGPLHQFQIEEEVRSLYGEPEYRDGDHGQITLIHEGPLRVAVFAFHTGNELHDHRVSGPITVQVVSGRIVFSTDDGRSIEMKKGNLLSLEGGITHSVEALEDSVFLLTVVQVGDPAKQGDEG